MCVLAVSAQRRDTYKHKKENTTTSYHLSEVSASAGAEVLPPRLGEAPGHDAPADLGGVGVVEVVLAAAVAAAAAAGDAVAPEAGPRGLCAE